MISSFPRPVVHCSCNTPPDQIPVHQIAEPQAVDPSQCVTIDLRKMTEWERRLRTVNDPSLPVQETVDVAQRMQLITDKIFQKTLISSFNSILPKILTPRFATLWNQLRDKYVHPETELQTKNRIENRMIEIAREHFNKNAIVLVEGGKSNKWVAELALYRKGRLAFAPFQFNRLGPKDAYDFTAWLEERPEHLHELRGKSIVLFDDGSFSGKQLHDHVQAIRERAKGIIQNICVVVPYATQHAQHLISSLNSAECPVHLSKTTTIETLGTIGSSGQAAATAWNEDLHLGLTAFSFKLPNYQSFPTFLAEGKLFQLCKGKHSYPFIQNKIPPYKGAPGLGASSRFDASADWKRVPPSLSKHRSGAHTTPHRLLSADAGEAPPVELDYKRHSRSTPHLLQLRSPKVIKPKDAIRSNFEHPIDDLQIDTLDLRSPLKPIENTSQGILDLSP